MSHIFVFDVKTQSISVKFATKNWFKNTLDKNIDSQHNCIDMQDEVLISTHWVPVFIERIFEKIVDYKNFENTWTDKNMTCKGLHVLEKRRR